ncbi:MAG TPA: type II toxin-antitoxin system VapC family toxin [Silvibacterium sp.]|nr:type II toxin-antitoxin system VapC family toxin [Silvibacterium sp.]
MPFVLDASVVTSWALSDENEPAATAALMRARKDSCAVPALWRFEIRNALLMAERRKRLSGAETNKFLHELAGLHIDEDFSTDETALLRLARHHNLTVYDAAYLELAWRRSIPLATLDRVLARAARAEKVPVIGHHA